MWRGTIIFLLFFFIISLFWLYSVNGCVGKKKKAKPHYDPNNPPTPRPSQNPLGDNVKQSPYDNSVYDGKNGEATSPDDLKCDFESPCCWKNTKPPYDTMDWNVGSGSPDPEKFKDIFASSELPSGQFLMVTVDPDRKPQESDKAEFESCSIPCTTDSIKVTLKHWQTLGVKLEVCQVAKSDPTTLTNCQEVPSTAPGPDTITLPPASDTIITIIASGFTSSPAAAVIDDISVDYPPCSSSGTPGTTQPGPGPGPAVGAKKLCCNFDQGGCDCWNKGSGPSKAIGNVKEFEKAGPERYGNPATGVPPSPDKFFYAAYLKPKESAYSECQADLDQETTIKFSEYKVTQDLTLKACCDVDQDCTYATGGKVEKGDFRQWYSAAIKCPAGTKKVIFYSENTGENEGGVAIDNVEVAGADGKSVC